MREDHTESAARPADRCGTVVSIIGPDGSGKSTLARKVVQEIGVRATRQHMGGPPDGTFVTRHLRMAIKFVLKLWCRLRRDGSPVDVERRYPTFQAMLDVCTALDRLRMVIRCHALKREGWVVIADRYPGRVPGSANGPQRPRATTFAASALNRIEKFIYEKMPLPDLVCRLSVPVETSVARNAARLAPKPSQVVRASHEAVRLLSFPGVPELGFDTSRPEQETANLLLSASRAHLHGAADAVSKSA